MLVIQSRIHLLDACPSEFRGTIAARWDFEVSERNPGLAEGMEAVGYGGEQGFGRVGFGGEMADCAG